ncbi:bifunctional folylpolyglutamate synthase/dihydrofolate synthase [Labilibacter sediminis]|nr:bifunctional folylpolyglutamate synthase/dihydrofolate synthase [Labilibacter sediminis]
MDYIEVLDFLFAQLPMYQRSGKVAYKANLDNTHKLDAYFNHPHQQYKTIHVAGTNGKGSVSHCLTSVLMQAGYKVGLYTSPHLKDFRERIKINGQCIPEQDVIDFVTDHQELIKDIKPSFFEMTVALAFNYFAEQKIDIAIVEVGLGGRLDSTNIISPLCSVITNIGLDHTALLGDSKEKIAPEKAGIIKSNTPVVIGETDTITKPIFDRLAKQNNASIYYADRCYHIPVAMTSVEAKQILQIYEEDTIKYPDLELDLLGSYQQKNIKTVIKALDVLTACGLNISKDSIYSGLKDVVKNTGLLGRWQILGANPAVICDSGHNTEGVKELMEQIKQTPHKNLHMVWGMVNDKDITSVLNLLPKNATYYFAKPNIPRGLEAEQLKKSAFECGLIGESYNSIKNALFFAKKNASSNDLIFIGGSTFVVAEVV